jgi:hypothetical protein
MHAPPGTIHIKKIAAAGRQLDAAIRMFFAKEDELAIHTVASAAFRILRDLIKKRGKNFADDVLRVGIYAMAQQYAEGALPKDMLKLLENTQMMAVIEYILDNERAQADNFDLSRIVFRGDRTNDRRAWPSKAANFLKHANRDSEEHLALNEIKNEDVLIGACIAYSELMKMLTTEMMAFIAFWAAKNDAEGGRRFRHWCRS